MKTLSILTAAAGIVLAISGPSLAASRTHKQHQLPSTEAYSSYARDNSFSRQYSDPYSFAPGGTSAYPFGPGRNLPYNDRPYGNPDNW
jgi:hypothetical protein